MPRFSAGSFIFISLYRPDSAITSRGVCMNSSLKCQGVLQHLIVSMDVQKKVGVSSAVNKQNSAIMYPLFIDFPKFLEISISLKKKLQTTTLSQLLNKLYKSHAFQGTPLVCFKDEYFWEWGSLVYRYFGKPRFGVNSIGPDVRVWMT